MRARKLYNAGYKDIEAIRKAEFKALADIIGPKIAANTLKQLGIDVEQVQDTANKLAVKSTGQQNIIGF